MTFVKKKKIINIRGLRIGEGLPKICIPLTGDREETLRTQLKKLEDIPFDMAEWRVDYFVPWQQKDRRLAMSAEIRTYLKEKPLLLTFRTRFEGGEADIDPEGYYSLCTELARDPNADLVDVEYCTLSEAMLQDLIEEIHAIGKYIVGSNHDFHETPETEAMIGRLRAMQELDMDITKLAVMPQNKTDTLHLLEAAVRMDEMYADRPCITIAMGEKGAVSRAIGSFTGSAVTFGSAGFSSAPGQFPAEDLSRILRLLSPDKYDS